jgi:hypothetical protein
MGTPRFRAIGAGIQPMTATGIGANRTTDVKDGRPDRMRTISGAQTIPERAWPSHPPTGAATSFWGCTRGLWPMMLCPR